VESGGKILERQDPGPLLAQAIQDFRFARQHSAKSILTKQIGLGALCSPRLPLSS
jgi:hypothetical protein